MKISGTATLHAPPPQAWAALNDPAVLARTIPGCEHLEAAGRTMERIALRHALHANGFGQTPRQRPRWHPL